MAVEIVPMRSSELPEYATVPISFPATHRLRFTVGPKLSLEAPEPLATPFVKDYDRLSGMSPLEWCTRFQLGSWGLFVAREEGSVVGGTAVAPATEVGIADAALGEAAVLWDLRVLPAKRGRRVGSALFRAVEQWAANRGHVALIAESQDINVAACRFYQAMGCSLIAYVPHAYPDFPDEARVIWRRDL